MRVSLSLLVRIVGSTAAGLIGLTPAWAQPTLTVSSDVVTPGTT